MGAFRRVSLRDLEVYVKYLYNNYNINMLKNSPCFAQKKIGYKNVLKNILHFFYVVKTLLREYQCFVEYHVFLKYGKANYCCRGWISYE